jgi:hypothetical protein
MMADTMLDFDRRVRDIEKKHQKPATGGIRRVMDASGLMTVEARRQIRLPIGPMIVGVLAFFVFKAFLLHNLGPDGYADRILELKRGTIIEQTGGFLMDVDPVSQFIAQKFSGLGRV